MSRPGARPSRASLLLAACLLVSLVPALHAVAPDFASLVPAGGQRGTTVEVTLRGQRLADAAEVLFYDQGISVERIVSTAEREVKVAFRIAPDCRPGEHPLRLRTASGLSSLRLFYVGPFPTVQEKEPNDTRAAGQLVTLGSTIEGTLTAEDVDHFRVELRQGQRLSLEIEGARLGRTMLDPLLSILGTDGRVLASVDDTALLGHDGYLAWTAPAAGTYAIQLRDAAYSGNGHAYRLHVGDFPRPALVFPLGGRAGETIEARFVGDPSGEIIQNIRLPASPRARVAAVAERAPSPNWIRASDLPNAESVRTTPTADNAPILNLPAPVAFNGILTTPGEPAFFRFHATKGQNLDCNVHARRLGSPLDSVLTVLDAKGKTLGSNDDAAGNPDSSVRVKIAEDGVYTVKVADQLGRGGPTFGYRLEISEVRPQLVLSIPDTARYDYETRKSLAVPRGNRFAVLLNLARDGCNDELAVDFPGLPSGISFQADKVPGSLSAVPVVFEAAPDAALAGDLLQPGAAPVDAAKAAGITSRYRHTVDWVRIQNDTMYVRSEVDRIAAAVVEEVPFKVSIVQPKVPIVQGGDLELRIVAEKREGFDEPITVKMLWNPPGLSALPDMVIPKGSTSVAYKLNATARAETRLWRTAAVASAPVKGGTAYVSTQLAILEVSAPFLAGKIDLTKVTRGQPGKLVCSLEQKLPFEGEATVTLVGLPANVTAEPVQVTKDSREAVFTVVTNDRSPLGNHRNLFCRAVITRDGEPIAHVIAQGGVLRLDAPRTPSVAAAAPAPAAKP